MTTNMSKRERIIDSAVHDLVALCRLRCICADDLVALLNRHAPECPHKDVEQMIRQIVTSAVGRA